MPWTGECSSMMTAPVNKIIPFSNVDGPGNRTALFFQQCSFSCLFCHNPETIHLCNSCGACVSACPAGALTIKEDRVIWSPEDCVQCDTCLKICPHLASPRVRWMTVEEVLQEVKRTAPYIEGITVSGGECSLRHTFLTQLFPLVHALGKTCLMDSNGSLDFSLYPELLSVCDGIMLDIKAVDPDWCMQLLGNEGRMPLQNLDFLLQQGKLQEVRTVLFPHRDTENEKTIRYVAGHIGAAVPYKLIRYRPFGVRPAGLAVLSEDMTSEESARTWEELARSLGASQAFVI